MMAAASAQCTGAAVGSSRSVWQQRVDCDDDDNDEGGQRNMNGACCCNIKKETAAAVRAVKVIHIGAKRYTYGKRRSFGSRR